MTKLLTIFYKHIIPYKEKKQTLMPNRQLLICLIVLCFSCRTFAEEKPILQFSVGEKHPMIPHATQVLQTAYEKMGINIEVLQLPGARSTKLLEHGEIDGELFRGIKFENTLTNIIRIPVAIAQGKIMAFSTQKNIKIDGWESLQNYRIGALFRMKENAKTDISLQIQYIRTRELLFKMLIRNRIDIVVVPKRLGMFYIAQMQLKGVYMLQGPVQQDNLYHYLDQKNAHIVPQITKILQQMQDDGEIDSINKRAESELLQEIKALNNYSVSAPETVITLDH